MDTGSREENASKQELRASVLILSEPKCSAALAATIMCGGATLDNTHTPVDRTRDDPVAIDLGSEVAQRS
jgi:hypothetical protein